MSTEGFERCSNDGSRFSWVSFVLCHPFTNSHTGTLLVCLVTSCTKKADQWKEMMIDNSISALHSVSSGKGTHSTQWLHSSLVNSQFVDQPQNSKGKDIRFQPGEGFLGLSYLQVPLQAAKLPTLVVDVPSSHLHRFVEQIQVRDPWKKESNTKEGIRKGFAPLRVSNLEICLQCSFVFSMSAGSYNSNDLSHKDFFLFIGHVENSTSMHTWRRFHECCISKQGTT